MNIGCGITAKVFEMLNDYGCTDASSYLLTGGSFLDIKQRKILPSWVRCLMDPTHSIFFFYVFLIFCFCFQIPMQDKISSVTTGKDACQALVSGDPYLIDYVNRPDQTLAATLPSTLHPSCVLSFNLGLKCLEKGNSLDAITFLDLAGNRRSERILIDLLLSLSLNSSSDTSKFLQSLTDGKIANGGSADVDNTDQAMAFLALDLKKRQSNNQILLEEGECYGMRDDNYLYLKDQLAQSYSHGTLYSQRVRDRLIETKGSINSDHSNIKHCDRHWDTANDEKHIW